MTDEARFEAHKVKISAELEGLSYSRGETINCGNFNNVKIEIGAVVELDLDEDANQTLDHLIEAVNSKVAKEAAKHKR